MSTNNLVKGGPVSLRDITERCMFYSSPSITSAYNGEYGMRTYYTPGGSGSNYFVACYGCKGPTGSGSTGMGDLSLLELGRTRSYDHPTQWTCSPRIVSSGFKGESHECESSDDGTGSNGTVRESPEGGGGTITKTAYTAGPGAKYVTGWWYNHNITGKVRHLHYQLKNSGTGSGCKVGYEMIAFASGYLAGSAQQLIDEFDSNTGRTIVMETPVNLPSSKRYIVCAICAWAAAGTTSSWSIKKWQVGSL